MQASAAGCCRLVLLVGIAHPAKLELEVLLPKKASVFELSSWERAKACARRLGECAWGATPLRSESALSLCVKTAEAAASDARAAAAEAAAATAAAPSSNQLINNDTESPAQSLGERSRDDELVTAAGDVNGSISALQAAVQEKDDELRGLAADRDAALERVSALEGELLEERERNRVLEGDLRAQLASLQLSMESKEAAGSGGNECAGIGGASSQECAVKGEGERGQDAGDAEAASASHYKMQLEEKAKVQAMSRAARALLHYLTQSNDATLLYATLLFSTVIWSTLICSTLLWLSRVALALPGLPNDQRVIHTLLTPSSSMIQSDCGNAGEQHSAPEKCDLWPPIQGAHARGRDGKLRRGGGSSGAGCRSSGN